MTDIFFLILRRDLTLAFRHRSDILLVLFFFTVVVTMIPLGAGPDTVLLKRIAPGLVWVAALLSALLSLSSLYEEDYEDGTLEQMLLVGEPLSVIVLAKITAHWTMTGLPMTLFSAVFGIMFDLEPEVTATLMTGLLLGSPVLSLVGSVGASLTVGLRSKGMLTSILVLPLYVPVLIFGSLAGRSVADGLSPVSYFMIIGSISLVSLAVAPAASAAALRIAQN